MGNKPLTIGLKVNTEGPHPAGSIVYGTVYLSAPKKPQMAQSLQLRVIGKEELVVHHSTTQQQDNHHHRHHQGHEGHGRNHRRSNHHQSSSNNSHESETRHYYERSTNDILQMEYPLRIFPDGKVPVGQYEFPFALQLPSNLPSTMSCRKGQSSCEVKFEIMAELYQQPPSLLHTNPHSKQELVVEASTDISPRHDTSFALPAEMIPVTGCCCSKNGYMSLETKFDKTTIPVVSTTTNTRHNNNNNNNSSNNRNHQDNTLASNTFSVDFRCQNKSTIAVDRIRLQLIETIEWASNGYQEQVKTVLAKVDVDAQQFRDLDKLRKRDLRRLQRREYFGLTNNNNNDNGDMLTLQHQPWHTIGPVQIPRYAKDSYHGRAIQIRHVLIVELITTGCCISNPDASTIVQIYRRLAEPPQHDHDFQDGDDDNGGWATTPSAPLEETTSSLSPSAPSEFYDEPHSSTTSVFAEGTTPVVVSSSDVLVVEAQALPPDWHAETAEIVTIPMAEAILLGPTTPSTSSSRRVTSTTTTTPLWST